MPDGLWTINALSAELGIDRRTLSRRLRGTAAARMEGRSRLFALRDVFTALLALEKGDPRELNAERTRLAKAQADRATLDMQERRGELVEAEAVRRTAFATARRTRDQLLALPDRIASALAATSEPHEVCRILTEEIERVCEELSTDPLRNRLKPGRKHATD